ncbi:AraC family transcriptional regulator [Nocardia sp. SYP-A9097]|uniref:AraC family transcriptional regulator n=1 Tax=Nocardia sp. SYP-A9097 TaxID=2663237 RepID=UPI001890C350|nr:AraC family transcriptional regulator [Nocardia sp. SYP-A9097]
MAPQPQALTDAVIPPIVLSGVVEIGLHLGLSAGSWFAETGLDAERLLDSGNAPVSYDQAATVLRRALRALPPGPWGIRLGQRDILISMGLLGVALSSCATLGDALALGSELHLASGSLVDVDFEILDGEVVLNLRQRETDTALEIFLFEEALCTAVTFLRTMLGAGRSPSSVELSYPAPAYADEYARFFRCPVVFGAGATRMRVSAALLAHRLPHHHEPTRTVAAAACRQLISSHNVEKDIVLAVEALLEGHARTPLTVTAVARRLNLSERTLRRQLSSAGEGFSTVRDRVRARCATLLLRESTLTIDAIAREMGFSDGREFRRAYIRWTGRSPLSVRNDRN